MAEDVIAQQKDYAGVCIPTNITKSSFVSFSWDNNDINEETLTGCGTTHGTNGIVIQQ